MKRALLSLTYGLGGVLFAGLLTLGAFALAGEPLSQPARPLKLPEDKALVQEAKTSADTTSQPPNTLEGRESPKPSDEPFESPDGEVSVGSDNGSTGDTSEDTNKDDENGDNSGSGSDNSGSGSEDSGSGSGDSGSGSDDGADHDGDDDRPEDDD